MLVEHRVFAERECSTNDSVRSGGSLKAMFRSPAAIIRLLAGSVSPTEAERSEMMRWAVALGGTTRRRLSPRRTLLEHKEVLDPPTAH